MWRPVFELHAESQAARSKDFLDFVERLAAQIRRLEQFRLGTLNQVADVIDVLGLQAIGGTHRQFEIVDGTQQQGIDHRLLRCFGRHGSAFEIGKDRKLIHQHTSRITDRLFGVDGTIGFDVHDQLVEVGTLFDTSRFDGIADPADRAERSVQHDVADAARFLVARTHGRRHVATALFNLDLHFQLAAGGDVGNHVIRIDDFDIMRDLDVSRGHHTLALFGEHQRGFVAVVQLEHDALDIEEDIHDILTHAIQCGVLVQHALDACCRRRIAVHRREQDTAQGIAQRVAIATLERFHDDTSMHRRERLYINVARFQKSASLHLHPFL
ncbi:protein of unknown function [Sterolibacterium denitrificans]|uniref:Uncharacterized protein n=1 Tax=Sterolibacterium denitrificans TaxID=157592 RepID=A0A7Z7MUN3_9PROT|nr:protein of unknown function [Sterolibacterium denitrificans]